MRIEPYRHGDLAQVQAQPWQAAFGVPRCEPAGFAFTAWEDRPIGCAGVFEVWDGVGQAWMVLSLDILCRPVPLVRAVRRLLRDVMSDGGFIRVQASVADGHQAGHRFARCMGFRAEGLMRSYGPGGKGDFWMYAHVRR